MLNDENIKKVVDLIATMDGVLHAQRGGSTIICGTDPNTTDVDINVLCTSFDAFKEWEKCGSDIYSGQDDGYAAFRKGPFNVLAFQDRAEFQAVLWCTSFAQKWGMPDKEHRYEFFRYVRNLARNQL